MADIAAPEPAFRMKGGRRLLSVAPIAGGDFRAAQANLPVFAWGQAIALVVADIDLDMHDGPSGGSDLLDLHPHFHQCVTAETLR